IGCLKGGAAKKKDRAVEVRPPVPLHLHARTIVRDGEDVFIGSQSLRRLELERRREVGLIVSDKTIAARIAKIFEADWESAAAGGIPVEKVAKKVAKAITEELAPVRPVLEEVAGRMNIPLEVNGSIDHAVKEAVKTAVEDAVHEAVSHKAGD